MIYLAANGLGINSSLQIYGTGEIVCDRRDGMGRLPTRQGEGNQSGREQVQFSGIVNTPDGKRNQGRERSGIIAVGNEISHGFPSTSRHVSVPFARPDLYRA